MSPLEISNHITSTCELLHMGCDEEPSPKILWGWEKGRIICLASSCLLFPISQSSLHGTFTLSYVGIMSSDPWWSLGKTYPTSCDVAFHWSPGVEGWPSMNVLHVLVWTISGGGLRRNSSHLGNLTKWWRWGWWFSLWGETIPSEKRRWGNRRDCTIYMLRFIPWFTNLWH